MKTSFVCLVVLLFSNFTWARWARLDESTSVVKMLKVQNHVRKNGTVSRTYHKRVLIKKEAARTEMGLYRFNFNPKATRLGKIEAWTWNGSTKTLVKKSDIEIKPLAATGPGFDTQNQVTVAFPKIEVGSEIEIKIESEDFTPMVPGVYSSIILLGLNEHIENYSETWDSESPLNAEISDPQSHLNFEQKKIISR